MSVKEIQSHYVEGGAPHHERVIPSSPLSYVGEAAERRSQNCADVVLAVRQKKQEGQCHDSDERAAQN